MHALKGQKGLGGGIYVKGGDTLITETFLLHPGSITGDFEWSEQDLEEFIKTWEEI